MLRLRIREVAEQRGLTPRTLARLAQIDPKTVLALWYNPYRDIKASTLNRCANALNMSLHDLVEEEPGEEWSPLDQWGEEIVEGKLESISSIFIERTGRVKRA